MPVPNLCRVSHLLRPIEEESPLAKGLVCSAWFEETGVGDATDIACLIGAISIVVDLIVKQHTMFERGPMPSSAFIALRHVASGKLPPMLQGFPAGSHINLRILREGVLEHTYIHNNGLGYG